MALLLTIFTRFKKEVETSDHHKDENLRTHYYKGSFNQIFDSAEKIFKDDADCQITTVSKEHGEIAVEVKKPFPCFLVATIVSVKPLETAVDFNISTDKFSLFGIYPQLTGRISSFYQKLNQQHHNLAVKK
ncbi:hypothetical protein [Bacillus rubiinfantis]|uniref:hypothetical protein n=1 Tax=Bacillus rubiinfantis TaxID=1499680 RepID=UPI0005A8E70D|nr:hypothetical protein [Bacillus rubiinfantis]